MPQVLQSEMKAKVLLDAGETGEPLTIRINMNAGSNEHGWKVDPATWEWRMEEAQSGGGELVFDDGKCRLGFGHERRRYY